MGEFRQYCQALVGRALVTKKALYKCSPVQEVGGQLEGTLWVEERLRHEQDRMMQQNYCLQCRYSKPCLYCFIEEYVL